MELCIIIPAYNCLDTIEKTLKSISIQDLSVEYEVVLVNDCSDCDYSTIINNYSNKINIREIKTKKNIGPGAARQFGIDNSSSKYITFIDGDDCFYDKYSLSKLYNEINKTNVDVVIGNFIYERDNKKIVQKKDFIWLHGKIYRRKFLEDNNIYFNNTRSNEDQGFNRLISFLNPKVSYINKIVYIYKENSNSITRKNTRLYDFEGLEWLCYNINWAIEEAEKRGFKSYLTSYEPLYLLATLYFYYIDLQYEYDVSKILLWTKELYTRYMRIESIIDDNMINNIIEDNKNFFKDYMDIKEYNISFNEFLDLIKKENNL